MAPREANAQHSTTARTVVYAQGFLGFLNRPPGVWAPLWREASLNARLVTCLFVATLSGVGTVNSGRLDNDIFRGAVNYRFMPSYY